MSSHPRVESIVELAAGARSLKEWRTALLHELMRAAAADAGIFAAIGAPSADTMTVEEISPRFVDRMRDEWTRYEHTMAPLFVCMRERVVADYRSAFGRDWDRNPLYDEIMRPQHLASMVHVLIQFAGHPPAFIMLARAAGSRAIDEEVLAMCKCLAPAIALADAAHRVHVPDLPSMSTDERSLLDYVRLGYTNEQIALAVGLSAFTVRNRLSRLYRRLGVSSRAELIGLSLGGRRD